MKAFKIIGIAIFRDRNLGFEVLGLCNFKCYHYLICVIYIYLFVLGLCNFKCYHYTARYILTVKRVLGLCNFKCYHYNL